MEEPTRLELVNSRFAIYGLTNLAMAPFIYLIYGWYPEPDLNRHGHNDRGILSPLCLPFHHPGFFIQFGAGNEVRTRDPDLGKVVLYH